MAASTITTKKLNEIGRAVACRDDVDNILNSGNDMGVGTVGFRSNTYNSAESTEVMYSRFRQALADLNNADNVNKISREIITKTDIHARQVQVHSTNQLEDRVNDLTLWKNELEEEIKAVALEIDNLNIWKYKLENALLAYELVKMIISDNLNAREQRDGADRVQDSLELGLLKVIHISIKFY